MKTHIAHMLCVMLALMSASTTSLAALQPPVNPNLSCSIPTVPLTETVTVYDDQYSFKFAKNIWGSTVTESTDNPYQGSKSLKVDFQASWSGIEFNGLQLYKHDTVGAIQVAVRGNMSGQNVRIYLLDEQRGKLGVDVPLSSYVTRGSFLPGWQIASVPIIDMLGTLNAPIGGFGFQSESSGTIWLDDIKLVKPEPDGLVTLFSEHPQAELNRWLTYLTETNDTPFHGTTAMRSDFTSAWGGIHFHLGGGVSTQEYGALTFAVRSDVSDLNIYPYVEDSNGNFISGGVRVSDYLYGDIDDAWKVVWIPLKDLTNQADVTVTDFYLEVDRAGTVWLDEVKVVESFGSPMAGYGPYDAPVTAVVDHDPSPYAVELHDGQVGNMSTGCLAYYGGTNPYGACDQGDPRPSVWGFQTVAGDGLDTVFNYTGGSYLWYNGHSGYDYGVSEGTRVNAVAYGEVTAVDQSWGQVEITHFADSGYKTYYTHMKNISVSLGDTVFKGTKIGEVYKTTPPGQLAAIHLHFTVRVWNGSSWVLGDAYGRPMSAVMWEQ